MKTLKKIMMALFAIACIGMTVACNKDNDNNNGGGSGNTDSRLVGTWKISSVIVDSLDMSQLVRGSQIIMNANGSGTINIMGQNNSFTWSTNGNTLTVIPSGNSSETITCNIASITATTCTLTSSNMSFPGVGPIEGQVTITITKEGGDTPQPDTNSYNTLILGTWQVDHMTYNGVDATEQMLHGTVKLSFYQGGTGLLNDNGETQNNNFSWVITGNIITITEHSHTMNFTINSLTSTECTFTGTNLEIDGHMVEGNITIHMTKTGDTPTPGPNPDPVTGELTGTSWGYSYSGTRTEQSITIDYTINMLLAFTSSTTGTLNETITAMGYSETENINFTYVYDVTSHTGTMTATFTNPETHESETSTLPFTYDLTTNTITVTNTTPDADEGFLPATLEFYRISK